MHTLEFFRLPLLDIVCKLFMYRSIVCKDNDDHDVSILHDNIRLYACFLVATGHFLLFIVYAMDKPSSGSSIPEPDMKIVTFSSKEMGRCRHIYNVYKVECTRRKCSD